MIAQADTNKDGIIDYAEFVHLLNCWWKVIELEWISSRNLELRSEE
jgi:hypothetical protein